MHYDGPPEVDLNGLNFKRATDLFLGSEAELALALGIGREEVKRFRNEPGRVPDEIMVRLGEVLVERGRGMVRVGELLARG